MVKIAPIFLLTFFIACNEFLKLYSPASLKALFGVQILKKVFGGKRCVRFILFIRRKMTVMHFICISNSSFRRFSKLNNWQIVEMMSIGSLKILIDQIFSVFHTIVWAINRTHQYLGSSRRDHRNMYITNYSTNTHYRIHNAASTNLIFTDMLVSNGFNMNSYDFFGYHTNVHTRTEVIYISDRYRSRFV